MAGGIVLLSLVILRELLEGALPSLETFGAAFLAGSTWSLRTQTFGVLAFVTGTLMTSAMAMLIAVPAGLGIAILLTEYAPASVRDVLSPVVELLAAIPSVVYGLWGILVLAPLVRDAVNPVVEASPLGWLPLFGTPRLGVSLLSASVVLAIMVVPIVASLSREILLGVPAAQREAALALGLTRWETVRHVVLSYGRAGLLGAAILGLGRALGETMAVTMLIGNSVRLTFDYFEPGATMASIVAAQFGEARAGSLHLSSLIGVGLVLFFISLVVNAGARLLVRRLGHAGAGGTAA